MPVGPAFTAGQQNSADKAQQMLGGSMSTYNRIQPDIDTAPKKNVGEGALVSLSGAAAGASLGTAVSSASMAGPVGAGVMGAAALANYIFS